MKVLYKIFIYDNMTAFYAIKVLHTFTAITTTYTVNKYIKKVQTIIDINRIVFSLKTLIFPFILQWCT